MPSKCNRECKCRIQWINNMPKIIFNWIEVCKLKAWELKLIHIWYREDYKINQCKLVMNYRCNNNIWMQTEVRLYSISHSSSFFYSSLLIWWVRRVKFINKICQEWCFPMSKLSLIPRLMQFKNRNLQMQMLWMIQIFSWCNNREWWH